MPNPNPVLDRLTAIEALLAGKIEILTSEQAAEFLSLELSYLWKLTSAGILPFSKPNGKKLYFDKADLVAWAMRNKNSSMDELSTEPDPYKLDSFSKQLSSFK